MTWQLSDPYAIEEDLEAMGPVVWNAWIHDVKPKLLQNPSPTNVGLRITETQGQQVWIPDTDVFVRFFSTDDGHVLLIQAVNLLDELG